MFGNHHDNHGPARSSPATNGLHKLVAGIHQFQSHVFHQQQEFFRTLANGQQPLGLFITCSDSRVNPNLITQTEPGELFILRNVGNIIPAYTSNTVDGATAAAIEFAVSALNVEYVIVCGHSHCGAMKALVDPTSVAEMPSVSGWLTHAESARRIVRENYKELDRNAQINVLIQENVLAQLENLRTHPAVAVRLSRRDLRLCGWVYKLETGEVFAFDPDVGQFVSLLEQPALADQAYARTAAMRSI
jgi:carbonic anhydrase